MRAEDKNVVCYRQKMIWICHVQVIPRIRIELNLDKVKKIRPYAKLKGMGALKGNCTGIDLP